MKKNFIKTIAMLLGISLTTVIAPTAVAQQGKGQAKKGATEENSNSDREASERRGRHKPTRLKDLVEKKKAEAKANVERGNNNKNSKELKADKHGAGKGNAYGKNKGELSGREFGQARAASAKLNGQQKREVLKQTITSGDTKVTEARGRLSRAVEELERQRRGGTITDAEYNEKKVTISRAEKAIQVLQERVNAARVLVSAPVVE